MDYIYDRLYLEEVQLMIEAIRKRKNGKYKMLLAIAQSPHSKDPQLLWKALEAEDRVTDEDAELDTTGFEKLKLITGQNPRIVVK